MSSSTPQRPPHIVPERDAVSGAMVIYSAYDSAMFVAYLTIMPALTTAIR